MNSKEIVDRMLDRITEQATVIADQRSLSDQMRRAAANQGQAQANAGRLARDLHDTRERIKAVEAAFNAWKASTPKLKPPPAFRSALDSLITEDIPF